jgi:hypothetical protein
VKDLPVACTLTAAELPARLAEIAALGRDHLTASEHDGERAILRFDPAARERLEAIVAAERQCCAFLDLDVEDGPDGLTLTVAGPPDAAPVVRDLAGAFVAGR